MDYVLQFGLPSTCTTRLHSAFFENRAALRRRGIIYPEFGTPPTAKSGAKHRLLEAVLNGVNPKHIGMPEDWAEKFRSETADGETCVVFGENLLDISKPEIALSLFPRGRTLVVA